MSSQGLPSLVFDLQSRRAQKRCAILAIILTAAVPVLLTGIPGIPLTLSISVLATLVVAAGFRHAGWLNGPSALVGITWRADALWILTDARGRNYEAVLSPASRMSPHAIWLRWTIQQPADSFAMRTWFRSRTLLLARGDLPDADFRRLLVRLRLDRSECAATATLAPPSPIP